MLFDNAGCDTPHARAAALNEAVVETALAYRRLSRLRRSVIVTSYPNRWRRRVAVHRSSITRNYGVDLPTRIAITPPVTHAPRPPAGR
jgi:hypothetical protein